MNICTSSFEKNNHLIMQNIFSLFAIMVTLTLYTRPLNDIFSFSFLLGLFIYLFYILNIVFSASSPPISSHISPLSHPNVFLLFLFRKVQASHRYEQHSHKAMVRLSPSHLERQPSMWNRFLKATQSLRDSPFSHC